jgi:hypothetical protein
MIRTVESWWAWHDADSSRWSPDEDPGAATADADRRCESWVAGESDDGPALATDPRPYHERRRDMPHCPECLSPDCYAINCDERDPDERDEGP